MANVKRALRGIPPKQPGEEPATECQLGFLRSFGFFSEKTIKGLGKWQASYLIDEANVIKAEGERSDESYYPSGKKKRGCLSSLILLVATLVAVVVLLKMFGPGSKDAVPTTNEEKPLSVASPGPKDKARPAQNETDSPAVAPPDVPPAPKVIEDIDPVSGLVRKLSSTPLPVTVETVDEINMRDETGKETPIPLGVALRINKRTPGGTLTLESAGKLYVGNEDRLLGKVKVKK